MKTITVKYGIQDIRREFECETTFDDIAADRELQALLGYGDNVRLLVNGVEMPGDAEIVDGSTVTVETRCNSKAAQQTVKVRYGVAEANRTFDIPVRVSMIKRDEELRAALGYGDNINVLMNGVALPDDAIIPHGATVVIETACNTKAN